MGKNPVPVEKQSLIKTIFLVNIIWVAVSAWAVYDEVETRRPWKKYQREFFALEARLLDVEIEKAREALDKPEVKKEREALLGELEEANKSIRNEGYVRAMARMKEAEIAFDEVQQEHTFAKSEYDEAFYFYKKARHDGADPAPYKAKLDELDKLMKELESGMAERRATLVEASAGVEVYTAKITDLRERVDAMTGQLETLREKRKKVASKHPEIRQWVLDGLDTVDRCHTCHMAIDRKGFEAPEIEEPYRTHPEFDTLLGGTHPPEKFGCTTCHEGQGAQIKGIGHRPFDHGRNDHYWIRPMAIKPFTESTCRKCHKQERTIKLAPTLNFGRSLFEELGCFGCHITEGFIDPRKVGPQLTGMKNKVNPGWLVKWIGYPKGLREGTRMPNFWPDALDDKGNPKAGSPGLKKRREEALAIAAYLWVNSSETIFESPGEGIVGDAEKGREIFSSIGCLGCHRPAALGVEPLPSREVKRDFAPDLSYVGSKSNHEWLYSWVRDPKKHWPHTKMPALKLTRQDTADVAAYLMTLTKDEPYPQPPVFNPGSEKEVEELSRKGHELIKWYGCYGCHDIRGFEKSVKVGAELTAFGSKPTARLDFGDAITDHHDQNWHNWTKLKLEDPRAFKTDKIKLKMPDFSLNGREVEALMVFLKSMQDEEIPPAYMKKLDKKEKSLLEGERLVRNYNCQGCHKLGGKGGDIALLLPDQAMAPPNLSGEGSKVQAAWLYQFLKNPETLRPWLAMRMPTFGLSNEEANTVISYFMALEDVEEYFVETPSPLDEASKKTAQEMFTALKCIQCHQLTSGEVSNISDLAPDLGMAKHRLRPLWIERWLIDPQAIQEGTKMPTYFPLLDEDDPGSIMTPLPHMLEGDAKKQIKVLRDYLMTLEE